MELLYAFVFDNKNTTIFRTIEYNSLYLHNKIAFKNEAKQDKGSLGGQRHFSDVVG